MTLPALLRGHTGALALAVLLTYPSGGAAAQSGLAETLAPLIEKADLPGTLGVHVVRLRDAKELYTNKARDTFNPASNLKLLTAAAALVELGPAHQFVTSFHGRVDGDRIATLVVRGGGDPSLRSRDVAWLCKQLVAQGIRRVDRIAIDASLFDGERLPPAFGQQPEETASFRAAVGALSVDRNAYTLHVRPGPRTGAPAELFVWNNDYLTLQNNVTTSRAGRVRVSVAHSATSQGMRAVASGSIPQRTGTVTLRKRVEDPSAFALSVLRRALKAAGIGGALVPTTVRVGRLPPLVAEWHSPPLSEILYAVGKWSDNFTAEMLLKTLGRQDDHPATSAKGAMRVRAVLKELGVPVRGLRVVNGSGLFVGNLVSPAQITSTLRAMARTPRLSNEYLAQLAVGREDGTLAHRLGRLPPGVTVRAKTGTLNDVVALSGYILPGVRGRAVAFSVLCNGIAGRQRDAKRLADALVTAMARWLVGQ